jgi:hypothetical protein
MSLRSVQTNLVTRPGICWLLVRISLICLGAGCARDRRSLNPGTQWRRNKFFANEDSERCSVSGLNGAERRALPPTKSEIGMPGFSCWLIWPRPLACLKDPLC